MPLLKNNLQAAQQQSGLVGVTTKWTSSNCEKSLNHALKQAVDWRPQAINELMTKLEEVVSSEYREIERNLVEAGDFNKFLVNFHVWVSHDPIKRHFQRFLRQPKPFNPMAERLK